MKTVAHYIAETMVAIHNCKRSNNTEWLQRHTARLDALVYTYMPSGSGWDCGTKIDIEKSNEANLVFTGSFHHMDEHGGYDGWTNHMVRARILSRLEYHC